MNYYDINFPCSQLLLICYVHHVHTIQSPDSMYTLGVLLSSISSQQSLLHNVYQILFVVFLMKNLIHYFNFTVLPTVDNYYFHYTQYIYLDVFVIYLLCNLSLNINSYSILRAALTLLSDRFSHSSSQIDNG